jgi:diguanylate cyclase (GGDEF)-like protein
MFLPLHHRWRLRIGTRLALAFCALLSLMLVLAALSASRLSELAVSYDRLASEQYEISVRVDEALHSADNAVRKLLVLIGLPRPARVQAYAQIDASNAQLDRALAGLEGRQIDADGGEVIHRVLQALRTYREAYIDTADLIEADDLEAARALLGSRTEVALNRLSDALNELTRRQRAATTRQSAELQAQIRTDQRVLWSLCAGAMLLGAVLALAVARSIVRPLRRAEAVGHLLAAGEYQHRIPVSGHDEVGRMSMVMNTLAEAVGEREQRLLRMAHTDHLTGLAQRMRFIAEAGELLAALRLRKGQAVLVCMDVDRLKNVNAVLGFDAGDAVLKDAATRLTTLFDRDARLARLGGGTFVLLVPMDDAADAPRVAQRVQDAVEHKVSWNNHTLDLSVSVGMALFPGHADEPESLLRRAEQAMFEGKRQRQPQMLYNPSTEASRRSHLNLLSDLQEAIGGGQLRQYLQPKVSSLDGRLQGAEALVRWLHPQRGWLPPSEFIPFAESTGRIRQVTQWMLEQAALTLSRWQARGIDLTLAVNVSTLDLQDSRLPDRVATVLRSHRVPAHRLQLELTETGLLASGPDPIRVLHALRELGIGLAIDDFGTGQSSLAYLQRLPVNELKIDRSFVDGVDADPRRQALLRSIVDIGHSLRLAVTAEGVETEAELTILRQAGCDLVQGYLIARPMATDAFEAWHARRDSNRQPEAAWT